MEDKYQNMTEDDISKTGGILLFSVTVVIVVFAITGNTLVILAIIRKQSLRSSSNILLANIALSDLLTTLSGVPAFGVRLLWPDFLRGRELLCEVWLFAYIACMSSSLMTMQCLSFDRYLKITKPRFMYERFFGKRKTMATVAVIWIWSAVSIYLSLFVCGTVEYTESLDGCYLKEGDIRSWMCHSILIVISIISCIFIMPLFFLLTLNTIRKSRLRVQNHAQNHEAKAYSKEEVVITKMMIAVLILFAICWIPYSITHFVNYAKFHSKRLNYMVGIFALMNTAVNPMIYIWMYKPIRASIREMFTYS